MTQSIEKSLSPWIAPTESAGSVVFTIRRIFLRTEKHFSISTAKIGVGSSKLRVLLLEVTRPVSETERKSRDGFNRGKSGLPLLGVSLRPLMPVIRLVLILRLSFTSRIVPITLRVAIIAKIILQFQTVIKTFFKLFSFYLQQADYTSIF